MNIFKTSILTAIATAARLLSGFIVMKLVAVLSGPQGVAQLGQFMSLTALLVVFAGGGVGPGVVKYLAEYKGDDEKVRTLLSSAFSFTLVASLSMCVLVLLFSRTIADWLLESQEFQWLIVVLAIAQIFVAMHNLVIATVNGMMDVKRLALIHVSGSAVGVVLPSVLGYYYKLDGVLLAFVVGQAALLLISFAAYKRSGYFSWSNIGWNSDRQSFSRLARFSLMTLTSALMAPIIQIAVRNYLAGEFSWEEVGYWQAVSKVSEAYLLFITMAISVYYLPKLSALTERQSFKDEIRKGFLVLMPLVVFSALVIYWCRELVTNILFSDDFHGALYLYAPQLIGDVVKVAAFLLSYVMLAKAMTRIFFISEVVFGLTYFIWAVVLTQQFGLIGSMYAFIINYLIYFVFSAIVASRYITKM
ncbi:O-antigen translocase [Pseudomonas protegens]|uniref:O-antigen translocase n=1 Tax=Pseudomonas protegens TaxID=380021 RepID=UPI00293702EE|nr:O-antigen translocase [Pseudomonas protegens]WOE82540.1 O-antigen translocase [Pseudomonas protegens]